MINGAKRITCSACLSPGRREMNRQQNIRAYPRLSQRFLAGTAIFLSNNMKLYCFINGKLLLLSSDFHLFLSIDLFIFFVKGGWGLKVRYEL